MFFFTYFSVISTDKVFSCLLQEIIQLLASTLCQNPNFMPFKINPNMDFPDFIHSFYFLLVTQSKSDENIFVLSWFSNHNYQTLCFFLHCSKTATVIWKRQEISNGHCHFSGGKFSPSNSYFKMLEMHYHRLQLLCESQFEMKSPLSRV